MDLISVIIPVYKTESSLRKCIESIINQTYLHLEIILINDGSPDNSGKICDEYSKVDSRIKVIHKKNGGVSSARNAGLNIANGKYIGFIDSDDFVEPTMFENLKNTIIKTRSQIAVCGYNIVHNNTITPSDKNGSPQLWNRDEFIRVILTEDYVKGFLCNKLFEAKLLKDVRLDENIDLLEDMHLIFSLLPMVQTISYISCALYYYVQSTESATNRIDHLFDASYNLKYCLVYEDIYQKFLKSNMREYIDYACVNTIIDAKIKYLNSSKKDKKQLKEINLLFKKYPSYLQLIKEAHIKQKIKYIVIRNLPFIYKLYRLIKIKRN